MKKHSTPYDTVSYRRYAVEHFDDIGSIEKHGQGDHCLTMAGDLVQSLKNEQIEAILAPSHVQNKDHIDHAYALVSLSPNISLICDPGKLFTFPIVVGPEGATYQNSERAGKFDFDFDKDSRDVICKLSDTEKKRVFLSRPFTEEDQHQLYSGLLAMDNAFFTELGLRFSVQLDIKGCRYRVIDPSVAGPSPNWIQLSMEENQQNIQDFETYMHTVYNTPKDFLQFWRSEEIRNKASKLQASAKERLSQRLQTAEVKTEDPKRYSGCLCGHILIFHLSARQCRAILEKKAKGASKPKKQHKKNRNPSVEATSSHQAVVHAVAASHAVTSAPELGIHDVTSVSLNVAAPLSAATDIVVKPVHMT